MATTSPDNLRTPNPGDPYNLVADLAVLANDVQDALNTRANVYKGTAAQRASFLSTATPGVLWQDTDGIGMLWKRSASAWVPAVWRWSGTATQMNAFTQAPNGFEWYNSSVGRNFVRVSGQWIPSSGLLASGVTTGDSSGISNTSASMVAVPGGAALSFTVSTPVERDVLITTQALCIATSGLTLQVGVRLTGATTYTPPLDSHGIVKIPGNSDMGGQGQRLATLSAGTTTATLMYRGTGTIRNPLVLFQAV